jgi:hypothetical protein
MRLFKRRHEPGHLPVSESELKAPIFQTARSESPDVRKREQPSDRVKENRGGDREAHTQARQRALIEDRPSKPSDSSLAAPRPTGVYTESCQARESRLTSVDEEDSTSVRAQGKLRSLPVPIPERAPVVSRDYRERHAGTRHDRSVALSSVFTQKPTRAEQPDEPMRGRELTDEATPFRMRERGVREASDKGRTPSEQRHPSRVIRDARELVSESAPAVANVHSSLRANAEDGLSHGTQRDSVNHKDPLESSRNRWPELPEPPHTEFVNEWESALREIERLRRLDMEQRGTRWSA